MTHYSSNLSSAVANLGLDPTISSPSHPASNNPSDPSATPAGLTSSAHSRRTSSSFGGSDALATSQTPLLYAEEHHPYSRLSTSSSTSSSEAGQESEHFNTVLEEDLQKCVQLFRQQNRFVGEMVESVRGKVQCRV
ncbi:hypothetical protein JCM1840_000198 [Sporobolomyces johnsonii]